jgi:hypothetical protein
MLGSYAGSTANPITDALAYLADNAVENTHYVLPLTANIDNWEMTTVSNATFHDKENVTFEITSEVPVSIKQKSDATGMAIFKGDNEYNVIISGKVSLVTGSSNSYALTLYAVNEPGSSGDDGNYTVTFKDDATISNVAAGSPFRVISGTLVLDGTNIHGNSGTIELGSSYPKNGKLVLQNGARIRSCTSNPVISVKKSMTLELRDGYIYDNTHLAVNLEAGSSGNVGDPPGVGDSTEFRILGGLYIYSGLIQGTTGTAEYPANLEGSVYLREDGYNGGDEDNGVIYFPNGGSANGSTFAAGEFLGDKDAHNNASSASFTIDTAVTAP